MKKITFQAVDWKAFDTITKMNTDLDVYRVIIFGRTLEGKTVTCVVDDFKPYFLICIPEIWGYDEMGLIEEQMKKYSYRTKILKIEFSTGKKYSSFNNYKDFKFAKLYFNNNENMQNASYVLQKKFYIKGEVYIFEIFESNIIPMLKIIHERKLNSTGWISIFNYIHVENEYRSDISITGSYKKLKKHESTEIAPLIIAAFDIECYSESGAFPSPTNINDKLIQIGTTFNYLGKNECFYKHIVTLKGCSKFSEDVDVESFNSEKKVILCWLKMLKKINPDIIVGHNTYGFDYMYIHKRASLLKIEHLIGKNFGRIRYINTIYEKLNITSSALGENKYHYYDTPGIVNFDFMKVMSNDPYVKLESYSLDFISNTFIRELVVKIMYEDNALLCKDKFGLEKDRYIKIISVSNSGDIYHNIGTKYKIIDIVENYKKTGFFGIIINKKISDVAGVNDKGEILNKRFPVLLCKAKDDMSAKQLFAKQLGSDNDRAEVAKYCIQDCILVNLLMEKQMIVMKSMAIAGVCNVPLSYVHLRGQGVKIFSLVVKFCNDKNYYVPLLKKMKQQIFETGTIEQEYSNNDKIYVTDVRRFSNDGEKYCKQSEIKNKLLPYEKKLIAAKITNARNKYAKVIKKISELNIEIYEKEKIHASTEIIDSFKKENSENYKIKKKLEKDYGNLLFDEKEEKKKKHYEGATIIAPIPGMYYSPVSVLDFLSLYPSSMIHKNISAESLILDPKYLDLPDHKYYTIRFKTGEGIDKICTYAKKKDGTKALLPLIEEYLLNTRAKVKKEMKTAKNKNIYMMLDALQYAYKIVANSLYGQTGSDFSGIYNLDNAASTTATGREMLVFAKIFAEYVFFKIVKFIEHGFNPKMKVNGKEKCESLIMFIFNKQIDKFLQNKKLINKLKLRETCGRKDYSYFEVLNDRDHSILDDNIEKQKIWISEFYNHICSILENGKYSTHMKCVYGDTDSIFPNFGIQEISSGTKLENEKSLIMSIKLAQECSNLINMVLPEPHNLQYEKTFWPFCIISKKRYTANKYEYSPDKYVQINMGIVLKRRDNAPISKIVIGGIVDILLNERNPAKAIEFTRNKTADILDGKIHIEDFIISKSIKENYKDRNNHAHIVTMDKRRVRDEGDVVQVGDRVPFVYVYQEKKIAKTKIKIKRSTTADDPIYVKKNNIPIDFEYYVTNQIRKPAEQFLDLVLPNSGKKIFDDLIHKYLDDKIGRKNLKEYTNKFEEVDEDDIVIDF